MCRAVPLSSSVFHPASALSAPLPLEGKALSVVILFSHMRVFALTLWGKRYSRIAAFPIGEGGPRQRCSGTFVNGALEMIFPALFHPASALSAPTGHFPLEGKALSVVMLFPHMRVFALTLWGKRYSRIVAFPIGEGGPRQRRSGTFVNGALEMIFPALFPAACALSAPMGHLPRKGKALSVVILFFTYACIRFDVLGEVVFSYRSLPLEGKALSVVILFPHMRVFALTLWGKRFSRIVAFPIGEGGPRQRWIGCSRITPA